MRICVTLAAVWLAVGCGASRPTDPGPKIDMHWRSLKSVCEVKSDYVTCQKEPFRRAMKSWIRTGRELAETRTELEAVRSLRGVDRAELEGTRRDRDRARAQRWWWGAVGTGIGIMLGGGIVAAFIL